MSPRTLVIVNPASAGGSTARRWRRVESHAREVLGAPEIEWTRAPRDAERLAREGARAGIERIVVAGGDGTLAEVASGLLGADLGSRVDLGLVPMGTGGDFARSFDWPRDPHAALDRLRDATAAVIDAGRAHYRAHDGGERRSHFLNVASIGVSGHAVRFARRAPGWIGGRAAFALGAVRALFSYRGERVALRVDGEPVRDAPLLLAAAANGRCFGGGMRIAPEAELADGCLDLVCVDPQSPWRLLPKLPRLYAGTHLDLPIVCCFRGRTIEVDGAAAIPLELDGDALGTTPARLELLPGALRLVGAPR